MIASWIVKRMLRNGFLKMNEDVFDVEAFVAMGPDDAIWDTTSDLGVGGTIRGKKAIADWFHRWIEEFPKRKFDVKSICFSSWPLNIFKNVATVQWSCTQIDKQGKTFKYDGATVFHMRNFKCIRATEYISFAGLSKLSDLIEPLAEG